jgi:hypothetical protein
LTIFVIFSFKIGRAIGVELFGDSGDTNVLRDYLLWRSFEIKIVTVIVTAPFQLLVLKSEESSLLFYSPETVVK